MPRRTVLTDEERTAKHIASCHAYYEKNKAKHDAVCRSYYERNKEIIKEKARIKYRETKALKMARAAENVINMENRAADP